MKQKITIIIMAAVLLITLCACGQSETEMGIENGVELAKDRSSFAVTFVAPVDGLDVTCIEKDKPDSTFGYIDDQEKVEKLAQDLSGEYEITEIIGVDELDLSPEKDMCIAHFEGDSIYIFEDGEFLYFPDNDTAYKCKKRGGKDIYKEITNQIQN